MGNPSTRSFLRIHSVLILLLVSHKLAMAMDFSTAILIRVDPSGLGDFERIQDAIDSVPSNSSELFFISVKPGIYREKIVVPEDKPFITLSGTDASITIITWNDTGGIFGSPTMAVFASDFVGRYLTIQNTFGNTAVAVALRVAGDRAAFYSCNILSYQDTLLDDTGKHYYLNCFIQGGVDFICGGAASLYERCHLDSIAEYVGAITAQKRMSEEDSTGFVFLGGKISGNGSTVLGRPWAAYSRVVFGFTEMSSVVVPAGWDDWNDPAKQRTAFYGEYRTYGPGANKTERVKWSHILTVEQAARFLTKDMIGGRDWLRPVPTHFKTRANSTKLLFN